MPKNTFILICRKILYERMITIIVKARFDFSEVSVVGNAFNQTGLV